ncbi:hypothetical protein [Candidatus Nardonella dryophthoridicola]|uniref:Proline--tRNA ligase n=1 Tax=endosymbiont of Metamasius hemipterus TaxID=204627 RepID=A0ABT0TW75_9GAMM|nr:hypothetical protein [Candidatus Nardonella dryophthoridicola]MCM0158252.1 hypothetical protein [endosymbiont of Metamasius hemipterus]
MKNTNYNLYINKNINLLKNKNKIYNIMIKAGLIKKFVSGFYTIMPLGLIIINNIKNIIIKNMNNIDMYEISMPILQPNDL